MPTREQDNEQEPNAVCGAQFWRGKNGEMYRSVIVTYVPPEELKNYQSQAVMALARVLCDLVDKEEQQLRTEEQTVATPRQRKKATVTLDNLPHELSVSQFANLAACSTSRVRSMIHTNQITARVINPESKRPTYRIQTLYLRHILGIEDEEKPYVSKLLTGRL